MVSVECRDEQLELLPDRAIFWRRTSTLLVADCHFGKAASFRRSGIPVPSGTTQNDLDRLSGLLEHTGSERLVILGDFFHAKNGRAPGTLDAMAAWRATYAQLQIVLVRGNHDARSGDPPCEWNFSCHEGPVVEGPFAWAHQPGAHDGAYVLAGHLHPGVLLGERGSQFLRAACFWFTPNYAVLPAFGRFTGLQIVEPKRGDRLFAVGPGEVLDVTPAAKPARKRLPVQAGGSQTSS